MKYILLTFFASFLIGCNNSFPEYKYFNQNNTTTSGNADPVETKPVSAVNPNDDTEKSYTEIFTVETP